MAPNVRDPSTQKMNDSHCKIEASIGYRVSSRLSWVCLRKQTTKEIKKANKQKSAA